MNTNVYQFNDQLAINIPFPALPPSQIRTEWIEELIPGYFHEIAEWIPLEVGSMEKGGRIPIFLPAETMSYLDIDVERLVEIRLMDVPGFWFPSHKRTETGYYWRVWIPKRVQEKLKLQPHTYAFAWIRGYTLPMKISRPIRHSVRNVIVEHMGVQYKPERITEDRWRWIIPETIESYPALKKAFTMNIVPIAEIDRRDNFVIVDFAFTKPAGRQVAGQMDAAYRYMAVRNYTATAELDYPFLCEIRATYLTTTPKQYYQPENKLYLMRYNEAIGLWNNEHYMDIQEALKITVYNILDEFFQRSKPEYEHSAMSYADHINAIEYVTTTVRLWQRYPKINRAAQKDITKSVYMRYETDTDREDENKYYSCIKYVRILNEHSYKNRKLNSYVYNDAYIKDILDAREEGGANIHVDTNGFVWR